MRGDQKTPHYIKVDWDKWVDEDDDGMLRILMFNDDYASSNVSTMPLWPYCRVLCCLIKCCSISIIRETILHRQCISQAKVEALNWSL